MFYKLWDKQESINGVEAIKILEKNPFKNESGDIILIYNGNRVSQIECKSILANLYNIDINLDLDSFMAVYFNAIKPSNEE